MITRQSIPVECPGAKKKYDGKGVRLRIKSEEKLVPVTGVFVVHYLKRRVFVDVHTYGVELRHASANSRGVCLHLSQRHVDSIQPTVPGSDEDFEIQLPLRSRYDDI